MALYKAIDFNTCIPSSTRQHTVSHPAHQRILSADNIRAKELNRYTTASSHKYWLKWF